MLRAAIRGIASYFPETELTNERLAEELGDWDAAKILEKTGIATRRIAADDECASDLAVAAAKKLFADGICRPEEIDFLLFCTQSPDYFLPATACVIQDRLGLRTDCGAIDFNQGCSGFVYGLSLAKNLIEGGDARNVLLLTAETYSKLINRRDRSVRTVFGDAAAATLVQAIESDVPFLGPFVFGTDGRGAKNLIVPAGGFRKPLSDDTAVEREDKSGNWRSEQDLYMNGPEIFNFTLASVPAAVNALLGKAGCAADDVDLFVLHQANRFMLDRLRAKMKIPEERFAIELEDCGNTVSSTIPIAIERACGRGELKAGQRLMLVGFGVGYSWAAGMMRVAPAEVGA
jgi:3-oxoacyl-[acyl-carrier-protein] synthase-3